MRIEYVYRTVYINVPAAGGGGSGAGAADAAAAQKRARNVMDKLLGAARTPEEQEKLKRLDGVIAAIFTAMKRLPDGMKGAMAAMLGSVLNAAASGDLDVATKMATNMLGLVEKLGGKANEAMNLMGQLRSLANAQQEPAKSMMMGLLGNAQEALGRATSADDVDGLMNILKQGIALGKELQSLPRGSEEYRAALGELQAISGELQLQNANKRAQSALAPEADAAMARLKAAPGAEAKKPQLAQLETLINRAQERGKDLPAGLRAAMAEQMKAAMAKAEGGDTAGAIKDMQQLAGKAEQGAALGKHVKAQLELAEALAKRQATPNPAVKATLAAAREAFERADSVEALQKAESQIGRALVLTDKANRPGGLSLAEKKELQELAHELGVQALPKTQTDQLKLSGPQAAKFDLEHVDIEAMTADELDVVAQMAEKLSAGKH